MRIATFVLVASLAVGCYAVPPGWCKSPGDIICSADCGSIEICRPTVDSGVYDSLILENCLMKTSCYDVDLTCSSTHSSCAPPKPFICSSLGSFPDPYDCRKYHFCLDNDVHSENTCNAGYAYNSLTKSCSINIEPAPRVCAFNPVPTCLAPGQAGTLCENTSLYYICYREDNVLYPILYQCTTGQVFDEQSFKCVDPAKAPNIITGCQYDKK